MIGAVGSENFLKRFVPSSVSYDRRPSLGTSLAMHSLLRLHGPRAQPLPQPTQEVTDFQGVTHKSGASAQDKSAFNNHRAAGRRYEAISLIFYDIVGT